MEILTKPEMSFIRIVPTPRIPFITMNWSTKSNLTITVELILITLISILETALSTSKYHWSTGLTHFHCHPISGDDHAYLYDVHRTTRPFALSDLYNPKYHTWTNIDETEEETDSMSCTIRMACGDDLVSEEGIVETDSVDGCRQACARSLAKCRYFTWFSEGIALIIHFSLFTFACTYVV